MQQELGVPESCCWIFFLTLPPLPSLQQHLCCCPPPLAQCTFCFLIYANHEDLGSPAIVWRNLNANAEKNPPLGRNQGASYLTMFSESGLIFGIINIIGNFGTVFVDQS